MAITRLMKRAEIADSPFRSLQEVERYLDLVKQQIDDEGNLLKQYQQQFSRTEKAYLQSEHAAPLVFKINKDGGTAPTRKPSPGIDAHNIDKIVIPKLDVLRKNFTIVDSLHEQIDNLETMEGNISVAFHGGRGLPEALKGIKLLKKHAQAKLDAALEFLAEVGQKYAPTQFRELVEHTSTEMIEKLTFEKSTTSLYCTDDENSLNFTYYIKLTNLTDEDDGDQFPEFYVVFTAKLVGVKTGAVRKDGLIKKVQSDNMQMKFFVTVMHQFETPGKFSPGRQVADHVDAMQALGILMAGEGLGNTIGAIPHNLSADDLSKDKFRVGNLVSDINVEADSLTFWFVTAVNKAAAVKAVNSLLVDIRTMSRQMKKASLKTKLVMEGRRYGVRFTITNPAQHDQLDIHAVQFLKDNFGIDDAKLRQVVKVLNS